MKKVAAVLFILFLYVGLAVALEKAREGRFVANNNGTVFDARTNLMWAAHDNGSDINWADAKSYCENYRGGGYTDWRMPTQDELEGLYDSTIIGNNDYRLTTLITLTASCLWASDTRRAAAAYFHFRYGSRHLSHQSNAANGRVLPVRDIR